MQFAPVDAQPKRFGGKTTKVLIIIGVSIVLSAVLIAAAIIRADKAAAPVPAGSREAAVEQDSQQAKLTFSAVGDLLAHDSVVQNAATQGGYDFYPFYSEVAPLMQKTDVRFCNQEGPVAGADLGISGYPTFNAPIEFARDANKAGCNLINLANNHVADKGLEGLTKTIDTWQQLKPLAIAGANKTAEEQRQVRYFEKNGLKVAFLAFADFSNNALIEGFALNRMDPELMRSLAAEARKNADAVIVSMHWGTEDSNAIDQQQKDAAALLAAQGVDVIIGTGPHVLQAVEKLPRNGGGETLVWYSIGNFLSTQLEAKQLIGRIALFDITKQAEGVAVDNIRFVPTYMHYEWSASDKAASRLSARKNLKLYPLARAGDALSRSQLGTTVDAQQRYVRETLGSVARIVDTN